MVHPVIKSDLYKQAKAMLERIGQVVLVCDQTGQWKTVKNLSDLKFHMKFAVDAVNEPYNRIVAIDDRY